MPPSATVTPIGLQVAAIPLSQAVPVVFTLVFIIWLIYTIVAAYHWLRYGNNLSFAIGIIILHVLVSSILAIYAVSGLH